MFVEERADEAVHWTFGLRAARPLMIDALK